MSKRQFKFVNAAEAQELLFNEVCKVLEITTGPALYQFNDVRLSIQTRHGEPKGYALEPPPNWEDLVYALTVLQVIIGAEGWERAIQREDGEIFTVDLERIQREGVWCDC
jgi:hypothetical protein|nr:MAG TPA: hypothetical protein [Caudoviricetes sp.]